MYTFLQIQYRKTKVQVAKNVQTGGWGGGRVHQVKHPMSDLLTLSWTLSNEFAQNHCQMGPGVIALLCQVWGYSRLGKVMDHHDSCIDP